MTREQQLAGFGAWALDPKRTDEEAYFAERAVEFGLARWWSRNNCTPPDHYSTMTERHKERRLNPAHRVQLKSADVEHAVEQLAEYTDLYLSCSSDRPLRDISGLRFFQHIQKLDLSQTEIADLTALAQLTELERLSISDDTVEDLRPVAALTKLRFLTLYCHRPWVRIDGFDALQQLEELLFSGNLLPCEDIRALPRVRKLSLSNTRFHLPLRDATRLPDMPALELLTLDTLYRLDGLERFPRLRNLTVGGNYRSLEPLTHLPALTHLYCATTEPLDLAPLCRLPELRSFKLKTEHPCDLFALTDAPKLRELTTENCDANAREVPTLQAILHSWDEDFLAPQPRPLAPLRYVVETKGRPSHGDDGCGKPGDKWAGNEGMRHSEAQWFEHRLQAAVRNFRGDAGGVKVDFGDWLTVNNVEAVHRLPELLEMARRILAECRYRRTLTVRVDFSERDEEPEKEWGDPDEVEAQRAAENRRYWKEQEREEAELREREYRLRQLRQEGVKIDPAEFAPPPPPPEVETEDDEAEEDDDDQVAHAIADEYRMHGYLTEEGFVAHSNWVADCERVLGRKMERD